MLNSRQAKVFFVHLQKTAGISFEKVLARKCIVLFDMATLAQPSTAHVMTIVASWMTGFVVSLFQISNS